MPARSRRPASPVSSRPNRTLIAIVLVVIGATMALGFERLVPGAIPGAPRASSPVASSAVADTAASEDPSLASDAPSDQPSDVASDSPAPSASPVAPILEAAMPHALNGSPLTVETDLGTSILGSDPYSRSFAAAVSTLGAKADQLEIGYAYDETGALSVTVLGFRIPGVTSAKLRPLVLSSWLSSGGPGVTTTNVTLAGTAVTRVSYGDKGADEYVLVRGDVVFIAETSDVATATAAVQAITGTAPSASPGAPGSTAAPSPTAS